MWDKTIWVRIAIAGLFLLGGLLFPVLFLVAAVCAWTIYRDLSTAEDLTDPSPSLVDQGDRYNLRRRIRSDDPTWKAQFLAYCESPAETAFLKAMVSAYSLKPADGVLEGCGLTLDMQVVVQPYRLDFLAHDWLVIEIDGAAYHSSPEAVERDRIRDEYLRSKGYTILRIPAKVVFNQPDDAVDWVRVALSAGRAVSDPVPQKTQPLKKSVTGTLNSASGSLDDLNKFVAKARARQIAMRKLRASFEMERKMIDSAIESAKKEIELDDELSADPDLKARYEGHIQFFQSILDEHQVEIPETNFNAEASFVPMQAPERHADPDIDDAIQNDYRSLVAERQAFLRDARERFHSDPRISELTRTHLHEFGAARCWDSLA